MFTGVKERDQWHKMAKISKFQLPKIEKGDSNFPSYE